jgi:hypothetical protein
MRADSGAVMREQVGRMRVAWLSKLKANGPRATGWRTRP